MFCLETVWCGVGVLDCERDWHAGSGLVGWGVGCVGVL